MSEQDTALPAWFHQQQITSLNKLIASEEAQREALVRWIAQIDDNVDKWTVQVAEHQEALSNV
jgi:hypothetical protein